MCNVILFLTFNLQTIMKQNYVKPRTIEVQVNAESLMYSYSTAVTGGYEYRPRMGTDGEGEYGEQVMNTWKNL